MAKGKKAPKKGKKGSCWKNYTAVGMKNKGGRKVPNCVPKRQGKAKR